MERPQRDRLQYDSSLLETAVLVGQSLTCAYFAHNELILKGFNLQFHRHLFAHTKTVGGCSVLFFVH